jgi:hypothetical protein
MNITVATIVILIGLMIYSGLTFKSQFENPQIIFKEEPIEKNAKLQILPGEEYKYTYIYNKTGVNITYFLIHGSGCTRIFIEESVNNTNICIDEGGMDSSGSNATYNNPAFLLFKPWMLALHPVWKWNNSMYMTYDNSLQHIADNHYRVIRVEDYKDRKAYVVAVNSSAGPAEYQWIDAEKRVLLRMVGEGYELVLTELPNNN